MSDKLLQEFLVRLTRTKNQVNDTKKQCEFHKKEARRLEKELGQLQHNRDELLKIEENLKVHYISTKVQNEEEFDKNNQEHEELLKLRKIKRVKQREKEQLMKDVERIQAEVSQVVKQREQLENIARNLSEKLDIASAERLQAEQEARKNGEILRKLTEELNGLKEEKESLNRVVVSTIEEELRTTKGSRLR